MSLSTQQAAFVEAIGNTVLCACPGSGKTFAVAEKAKKHMREWKKSHCGIAVLSFTNVAINEIKNVVLKDQSISYPHYFGTVDSFIDDFFMRYAGLYLTPPHRPHITYEYDTSRFKWRPECHNKGCIRDITDFHWNIEYDLLRGDHKVTCSPDDSGHAPCDHFKRNLLKRGIVYQIDVPMQCTRMLKRHPQIAQAIAKRYPVIIIDEAQDTSKEQMAFFDVLLENGVESIDLIGDPDQSIYEWRNATPECFIERMSDENWTPLYLSENRRSSQLICNATALFSKMLEGKAPNIAVGECKGYPQKPQLLIVPYGKNEDDVCALFKEKCIQLGIPEKDSAILTRRKIHEVREVKGVWKSQEVELFARASYEWSYGVRNHAYTACEKALYIMCIDDLENQKMPMEQELESRNMAYQEWRRVVLTILTRLQSADTALSLWIAGLKSLLQDSSLPVVFREGHSIDDIVKIKRSDKAHPDFHSKPLKCYFQLKETDTIIRSSIHGVKGETYDAVLLLALSVTGNTITRNLLCAGDLDCEMMRTAYVAMTRPRKYLAVAIAMPSKTSILNARFPESLWEYVYVN